MPTRSQPNNRAIAIVRVSSRRQEGGVSHETQEAEIADYARKQGLKLLDVVRITESAKDSDERKKYAAAMARAITEGIGHVLFYMIDRESRNLTDVERNEKLVRAGLISIHYVRDRKVLNTDTPDGDFLMRDVSAAVNKQYSRNLRTKVNDAMRHKAESGWYPSNHPPLGYVVQRTKQDGPVVVRDPDTASVRQVMREFELRAQGLSYRAIRDQVVAEGLVSPARAKTYRHNAVESRILNPFYAGRFVWQGLIYEGKHELIIPPLLHRSATQPGVVKRPRKAGPHGYFGSGFMRCGTCGCWIVFEVKRKRSRRTGVTQLFSYYRCSNGRKAHPSLSGLYVPEVEVWAQLEAALERIHLPVEHAAEIIRALNETHLREVAQATRRLSELRASLADIDVKEGKAFDLLEANVMDRDGYRRQAERLRNERQRVQLEIERAEAGLTRGSRENMQSIIELCKSAKELYLSQSLQERAVFLKQLVSNPLMNGRSIEFGLKFPFNEVAAIRDLVKW